MRALDIAAKAAPDVVRNGPGMAGVRRQVYALCGRDGLAQPVPGTGLIRCIVDRCEHEDRDLAIRHWCPWMERHSGLPASALVGRPLLASFPQLAERGLDSPFRQALAGSTVELREAEHGYLLPFPPPREVPGLFQHEKDTEQLRKISAELWPSDRKGDATIHGKGKAYGAEFLVKKLRIRYAAIWESRRESDQQENALAYDFAPLLS